MNAEEALRHGDLQTALEALQGNVRSDPASAKLRVFLFQLLCVLGDWERALNQLNVAGDLDAGTLAMVHTYRDLLQIEAMRNSVFAGKTTPLVFGEPEEWIALLIEAVKAEAQGEFARSAELRGTALESAPATSGTINDESFEWIADADPRLGPCLEVIVNGRYYWVPFNRVASIQCEEPEDLRDFVWTPAQFKWQNEGETVGFIPTRYPGAESDDDPLIRLARKTDWITVAEGVEHGVGQRLLATDANDYALLDVRTITLDAAAD
jgi:type VI secretion system protein ImpE